MCSWCGLNYSLEPWVGRECACVGRGLVFVLFDTGVDSFAVVVDICLELILCAVLEKVGEILWKIGVEVGW